MPANYPSIDAVLKSDSGAAPKRYRTVRNATVIEIELATYRQCQPFSGIFELVAPNKDPRIFQKKLCAEVYCAWHGVKPLTSYPHIHILKGFKIHKAYSGEVIDNLA